jgi:hypothetical protein
MNIEEEWWSISSARAIISLSLASIFLCLGYVAFANNWGTICVSLFLEITFLTAVCFFAEIILNPLYLITTKLEKRPPETPLESIKNSSGSQLLGILDYINENSYESINFNQMTAENIWQSKELLLKELTFIGENQKEKLLLIQKALKENHLWKIISLSIAYGIFLYVLYEVILFIVGALVSNHSLVFWKTMTGNDGPYYSVWMIAILTLSLLVYIGYQLYEDSQFKRALLELTNHAIERIELKNS